jgi:hypothetical protein
MLENLSKEQKSVIAKFCYRIALYMKDPNMANTSHEEVAAIVANNLDNYGIHTIPIGMTWMGVTRKEHLKEALEDNCDGGFDPDYWNARHARNTD